MSDPVSERLYALLPAIYRQRDLQQGQPLRSLMAVMQSQMLTMQADIEALYDNWFIETADDWVVPYLAELVGISDLSLGQAGAFSQRRRVANAIAYRRRKGATATLEHVLQDVTDWGIHVLEYAQLIGQTQHLAHTRPGTGRLVDLGETRILSALNAPFEASAHTADVRNTSLDPARARQAGKYRPDHLGIFVWRLKSYPVAFSPARAVVKDASGRRLPPVCYKFDPLGRDMPLFIQPAEVGQISDRTGPATVAQPLSRALLAADLADFAAQAAGMPVQNRPENSAYYGPEASLLICENETPVPPGAVVCADLSRWAAPPALTDPASGAAAAVDPELGRFMLNQRRRRGTREQIEVNFNYGFSDDLGGGPYPRALSLAQPQPDSLQLEVAQGGPLDSPAKALAAWEKTWKTTPRCIITILDSGVYAAETLLIKLPKNSQLVIQAADGQRPVLRLEKALVVENKPGGGSLALGGLYIDGRCELANPVNLGVSHCTLMPYGISAAQEAGSMPALQVAIDHSIVGPLRLPAGCQGLSASASILEGGAGAAIAGAHAGGPGPALDLQDVTIFGPVHARQVRQATGVIFGGILRVEDLDSGLVSFSYVPPGSRTPRRESCQPPAERESPDGRAAGEAAAPVFTSTRFGDPAYAQLGVSAPGTIRRGAPDGGEMGAFHDLFLVQRQDNLNAILDEFMPFGLEAGIYFIT